MKAWKKIVSAVLAGMMILSTVVAVGAANVAFTDTAKHWAKSQIDYLVSKEVLNGYKQSDGTYTFKPDGTVTRAEFIKMLDETFGLTATAPINYSDVKTSDWFHPYFSKAAAQGYLLNYGTSISPNSQLTREEATTLLVRYLGLLDAAKASSSQFTDYSSISTNFRDPVMIAVEAGLINGYKENNGTYTFRPKNTLTRAEALTILYRAAGAIYNTSAYAKDAGSADTNAVITKGDVTLSGLTLGGRVIVTEGASGGIVTLTGCSVPSTLEIRGASDVILNNCTVNAMTIDSIAPEIKVSLTGNSKVTSLTLDSKIALAISSGSRVADITVNTGAKNVKVTGDGAIDKASIYAAGFVSTMMPEEFYIASGLSANFSSTTFSGSSEDHAAFSAVPYITENNGDYCLNVLPEASGRVHFYFTNQSTIPSASEFDAGYASATYSDSFSVKADKIYTESTFSSSSVSRYKYVVIQLVSDNRSYAPVLIDNTPTSGTGFSVEPYYDGEDIVYKTAAAGTVYYYYSTSGDEVTAAQFQTAYNKADSALRGSEKISANRNGSVVLNDRYLANYPFVILVLENNNGQYYNPVVVSAGDNGFDEEPIVTTLGTIEFKTNVTGTLYYYYSKTDKMPTPQEFAKSWPLEKNRSSLSVTKNKTGSILYDTDLADQYPYMVFCVKENKGDYLTPFVLKIDYDTGFSVNPYLSASNEVTFRSEEAGTVYWFMSRYSTPPTMDEFMNEYNSTNNQRKGYERVYTSDAYGLFDFNKDYLEQYPYIYVMLVDLDGNTYYPVMLSAKATTTTGFDEEPNCDAENKRVYYKTTSEGTLYYYLDRANSSYGLTNEEFWEMYAFAGSYYSGYTLVDPVRDYIPYNQYDTSIYRGMVILFVDESGHEHYPVYVPLNTSSGTGTTNTGFTVQSVTRTKVTLLAHTNSTLRYYYVGTLSNPNQEYTGSTVYTNAGKTIEITHGGRYLYMVVEVDGYTEDVIDLTKEYNHDNTSTDGSTRTGYGFHGYDFNPNGGTLKFTATADVTGTVTMSISNMLNSDQTVAITAGSSFTVSIPFDLDAYLGTSQGQLIGGIVYVQVTDSDGEVYQRIGFQF